MNCMHWSSHLSGAIVDEQLSESPEGGSNLQDEVEVTFNERATVLGNVEVMQHLYIACIAGICFRAMREHYFALRVAAMST
jgi:hypothetical protein